jgi:ankyrin repeat protein
MKRTSNDIECSFPAFQTSRKIAEHHEVRDTKSTTYSNCGVNSSFLNQNLHRQHSNEDAMNGVFDAIEAQRRIAEELYDISWSSSSSTSQLVKDSSLSMQEDIDNYKDTTRRSKSKELRNKTQQTHVPLSHPKTELMECHHGFLEGSKIFRDNQRLCRIEVIDTALVSSSSSDAHFTSKVYEDSFQARARLFLQQYDDESLHSTSLSQSPTEYVKGSIFVPKFQKEEVNAFSQGKCQNHSQRDVRDATSSPNVHRYQLESPREQNFEIINDNSAIQLDLPNTTQLNEFSEFSLDSDEVSLISVLKYFTDSDDDSEKKDIHSPQQLPKKAVRFQNLETCGSYNHSKEDSHVKPTSQKSPWEQTLQRIYSSIDGSTLSLASTSHYSKSDLSLDSNMQIYNNIGVTERIKKINNPDQDVDQCGMVKVEEKIYLSKDAILKAGSLNQNFLGSNLPQELDKVTLHIPNDIDQQVGGCKQHTDNYECIAPSMVQKFHELCRYTDSHDDSRWRNAIKLLARQPELAMTKEDLKTPLHRACSRLSPAPDYFINALLVVAPETATMKDSSGMLPMHYLACTSAHVDLAKLLVQSNPLSVVTYDENGMIPLHLLLTNQEVQVTVQHVRLFLGQCICVAQHRHDLKWRNYPREIQCLLKRLYKWKESQMGLKISASKVDDMIDDTNPAAMPVKNSLQLAIHLAVANMRLTTCSKNLPWTLNSQKSSPNDSDNLGILRVLISAFPKSLVSKDSEGQTPLFIALSQEEQFPNLGLIEVLLGRGTINFDSNISHADKLDLPHPENEGWGNPAMIIAESAGQTPLHIAAELMTGNYSILSVIYNAYPGAIYVQDNRGRTPLHLALSNIHKAQLDVDSLSLLLSDRVAQMEDDEGLIPIDRFLRGGQRLPYLELSNKSRDDVQVYKRFIQASFAYYRGPGEVHLKCTLFRMQKLPHCLLQFALSEGSVQQMLLDQSVQKSFVFIILFHGTALITYLGLFRYYIDIYIRSQEFKADTTIFYILATFLIFFQGLVFYTSLKSGMFMSQCLLNALYWVDVFGISLALFTMHFMLTDAQEEVSLWGTIATGLLWCSVIAYVGRWWYGVARLFGGALFIVRHSIQPILVCFAILVGFTQIHLTSNLYSPSEMCDALVSGRSICDFNDSFRLFILLLSGTQLFQMSIIEDSGTVILLVVMSSLLTFIILSSFAILYREISSQGWDTLILRGYWENKLMFIHFMNNLNVNVFRRGILWMPCLAQLKMRLATLSFLTIPSSKIWDDSLRYVFPEQDRDDIKCCMVYSCLTNIFSFVRRFLVLVFLFVWLLLGICTFGLLWPPQVRAWIFMATTNSRVLNQKV